MNKTRFSRLHPASVFCYYVLAGVIVMTVWSPLVLLMFVLQAAVYLCLFSKRLRLKGISLYIALFLIIVATNLFFNSRGRHVLFYLLDRPVTAESLVWGLTTALSVCAVLMIFAAASINLTVSEFLYIFSPVMPKTALLISMAIGFVRLLLDRMVKISTVLRSKGIDASSGGLKKRCSDAAVVLNTLIALSLEEALTTADSMKAKGYGVCKRKSYRYRALYPKDIAYIIVEACLFLLIVSGYMKSPARAEILFANGDGVGVVYILTLIYLILPFAEEVRFYFRWKSLKRII